MAKIMLEDAAIRRAIKSLETAMNGILDINKSMTNKTNRLFDCWEGDSKTEFEKEYNLINSKTLDLSEALETMKEDLRCIADSFEEADNSVRNSILQQN